MLKREIDQGSIVELSKAEKGEGGSEGKNRWDRQEVVTCCAKDVLRERKRKEERNFSQDSSRENQTMSANYSDSLPFSRILLIMYSGVRRKRVALWFIESFKSLKGVQTFAKVSTFESHVQAAGKLEPIKRRRRLTKAEQGERQTKRRRREETKAGELSPIQRRPLAQYSPKVFFPM